MKLSLRFWQRCRYQFSCIVFWRCAELQHCQQQLASAGSWKHFRCIPLSADFRDFVLDVQDNWCLIGVQESWTIQGFGHDKLRWEARTHCQLQQVVRHELGGALPALLPEGFKHFNHVQSCYWRLETHTKTWTYDSVTDKMNVFGTCVLWKQLLCLPCGIKGTICYLIVPSAKTGYRRVAGCVTTPPFPVTRLPQCPVPNQWPHPTDLSGHNRWAARFSPSAPFVNEVDVLLRASKVTLHAKISDPLLSSRLHPLRMYMDWRHLRDGQPNTFPSDLGSLAVRAMKTIQIAFGWFYHSILTVMTVLSINWLRRQKSSFSPRNKLTSNLRHFGYASARFPAWNYTPLSCQL